MSYFFLTYEHVKTFILNYEVFSSEGKISKTADISSTAHLKFIWSVIPQLGTPTPLDKMNLTILNLLFFPIGLECMQCVSSAWKTLYNEKGTVLTTYSCFQSTAHSCSVAVTSVTTESSSGTTVSYCLDKRENISKGTSYLQNAKTSFLISQHKGKYLKSNILFVVTLFMITTCYVIFPVNGVLQFVFLPSKPFQSIFHLQFICCPI